MTIEELSSKTKEELISLIFTMGHVIRSLDEDSANVEYWTNDGDEDTPEDIAKAEKSFELYMALTADKFYGDNS